MAATSTASLLHIILAVLLPPLGVALAKGIGREFWICVVLTILGGVPGMVYALIVILAK
ncbi:YqaE/Pmp3 family membrane protein [Neolewinella agarilytica]|uniref:Uncharacterized membrane protein YqaE, homolog of Blt101, UPF0057 family n=1 Tax=Neolewinella agarilytica TaxID=478744 RepID=A0A1H9EIT3_9BACT|nr:YqaE/Pmp3 family membrane protein [Neolewinella agarilytica]SEQ25650.1 Uncharacterized membrane protein YqaE, homolog of Blt101, UPF0057 family [Neolewinella agarilytica]